MPVANTWRDKTLHYQPPHAHPNVSKRPIIKTCLRWDRCGLIQTTSRPSPVPQQVLYTTSIETFRITQCPNPNPFHIICNIVARRKHHTRTLTSLNKFIWNRFSFHQHNKPLTITRHAPLWMAHVPNPNPNPYRPTWTFLATSQNRPNGADITLFVSVHSRHVLTCTETLTLSQHNQYPPYSPHRFHVITNAQSTWTYLLI